MSQQKQSRMAQYMEIANDEEATDELRRLAITKHYQSLGTPAPSTASFQTHTSTSLKQVIDNDSESMETDKGGVALSSSPDESSSLPENFYPSPTHSAPISSELGGHSEQSATQQEIKNWASAHNDVFLDSLTTSVSALSDMTTAQTRPLGSSGSASSPGALYMDYSGQCPNGNSLTAPISAPASAQTPQYALAPIPHQFRPNNMVLERMGVICALGAQSHAGGNYLGHRSSMSNAREVLGLPDDKNCALFLTHIPVEATLHEIFSVIKTGAVFCLHINPPNAMHQTKAAKLAFMIPEAAAKFLAQISSINGVVLHGQRIRGRYNRNGYVRNEKPYQSRVLLLEGPPPMMTLEYWTSRFAKFSEFELESYRLSPIGTGGLSQIEFRFARIDGQAQTCLQSIVYDPTLNGVVHVKYGIDPCDPSME